MNNFVEQIIDILSNIGSRFDRLSDHVLNTYVEDARFASDIWKYFDSIGERSRTNNYQESQHRQLNASVRTHPDLWT